MGRLRPTPTAWDRDAAAQRISESDPAASWTGKSTIVDWGRDSFPKERGCVARKKGNMQKGAGKSVPHKVMFTQVLRMDFHLKAGFCRCILDMGQGKLITS